MAEIATTGNEQADERIKNYQAELAALTALALAGSIDEATFEAEMERIVFAMLLLMFLLAGGSVDAPGATDDLNEQRRIARASIAMLGDDIYSGRYSERDKPSTGRPVQTAEEGEKKLLNRLILWTFSAASLYAIGQLSTGEVLNQETGQREEPRYRWQYGDTDHCTDCLALNGVVLTASEWKRIGIRPQSPDLECTGRRCQCKFVLTNEPSVGIANVRI